MNQKANPKPIPEFEALRALSIILLLLLHSDVLSLPIYGIDISYVGAYVGAFLLGSFFFLAGYFTEVSLSKPGRTYFAFLKSKFIRIYPPYWLALMMFIYVMGYTLKRFDTAVYASNLQFIFSPAFVKQLLTLWYISIVMAYYVIFGFLLKSASSNAALFVWSAVIFLAAYLLHQASALMDDRFFEYYFIFLAGLFFSHFDQIRIHLFDVHFGYKFVTGLIGVLLFWLVQAAQFSVMQPLYLLAVDFFILSWIWMWLGIFRTSIGRWKIWEPISSASFFAYLFHRPIWRLAVPLFHVHGRSDNIMFYFIPGSVIVLILTYFLQRAYDGMLRRLKLSP